MCVLLCELMSRLTRSLECAACCREEHEQTIEEMWKEFDRLHTISPTPINPTVRTHSGGSRVTHQRREKIADEDMQYMIAKCLPRQTGSIKLALLTWSVEPRQLTVPCSWAGTASCCMSLLRQCGITGQTSAAIGCQRKTQTTQPSRAGPSNRNSRMIVQIKSYNSIGACRYRACINLSTGCPLARCGRVRLNKVY